MCDVLEGECALSALNVEMGFDVTLFSGVTARTSSCRMTILDLCGVRISKSPCLCGNQGDHLSGKPGNVREFGTCQGNVRDFVNSQGIVREMSGKKSCHGKVSQNCSLLDEYFLQKQ